jgi:hypothetical protein
LFCYEYGLSFGSAREGHLIKLEVDLVFALLISDWGLVNNLELVSLRSLLVEIAESGCTIIGWDCNIEEAK